MSTDRVPFFLMQRMQVVDRPQPGFDGMFSLDYMGAAEFEGGAIPESLARIRANRKVICKSVPVTRNDKSRNVFFVGGQAAVAHASAEFPGWLTAEREHSQERTYLREQFDGTADDYQSRTDAWWALRGDVMIALDPDVADRLVLAIKAVKRGQA